MLRTVTSPRDPDAEHAGVGAGGGTEPVAATEPITLTDPDGAVTRVAPWSTWTREQVRAPGGEPALVTRLDQGQLWFAAGRRQSPWRHEVQVGPAVVSTPRGRFHVTAEPDGGATIACLSGRTRIVAGLREPVILGPDQTAAVASDGATLVVMDRANNADYAFASDDDWPADVDEPVAAAAAGAAAASDHEESHLGATAGVGAAAAAVATTDAAGAPVTEAPAIRSIRRRRRLGWLPEAVAVLAIIGVAIAGFVVFADGTPDTRTDLARGIPTSSSTSAVSSGSSAPPATAPAVTSTAPPTTSGAPATSAPRTTAPPTTVPITTAPPATTPATTPPTTEPVTPPPTITGPPGTAVGRLASCRRDDGAVVASIDVTHRSGGPDVFTIDVALVDARGRAFAEAAGTSPVIERGSSAMVEVKVPTEGPVSGACELRAVTSG